MKIIKTTLPYQSLLNNSEKKYDYIDSFQGAINVIDNKFTSTDIGKAFFSSGPQWVSKLFSLRNKIVSVFGLKTSGENTNREKQLQNFKCEPGEHLNFRVSLFLGPQISGTTIKHTTVSTTVEFNNWFGRLYFIPVRPFHKLIVPTMLKGIIKEVEKKNGQHNVEK